MNSSRPVFCRPLLWVLSLISTILSADLLQAQTVPPAPLPMSVSYVYQIGNPYLYLPIAYYPAVYVSPNPWYLYSSPYPFGSVSPVFGLTSLDYGVAYPSTVGYVPSWYPTRWYPSPTGSGWVVGYPMLGGYPSHYLYYSYFFESAPLPGRTWLGYGY